VYRQEQAFDEWDRQMQADAEAGKFDELIQHAKEEHRSGKTPGFREALRYFKLLVSLPAVLPFPLSPAPPLSATSESHPD
jgi:hypothetical protein